MKYPKHIHYGNVTYELTFTTLKGCLGDCDPNKRRIRIQKGMGKRKTLETLVHELLHLVEFEENIPGFTHWHIRKLDRGLTQLLLDNFI